MQEVMNPTNFGYEQPPDSSSVLPKLMNQPPAPPELLNDIVCNCAIGSCASHCTCLDNEQLCTAACSCEALCSFDASDNSIACNNPFNWVTLHDSDSESDEA